jgi:hypothetical protein
VVLSTSTLVDQVGAAAFAPMPIYRRIEDHVMAARHLHGDDTTVPVLAKGKTDTARLWVYVHDDRTFAGSDPPAGLFYFPATGAACIRGRTGQGSCRLMPMAATTNSTRAAVSPHP